LNTLQIKRSSNGSGIFEYSSVRFNYSCSGTITFRTSFVPFQIVPRPTQKANTCLFSNRPRPTRDQLAMQSWLNPRCVFVCVYDSEEAVGIKKRGSIKTTVWSTTPTGHHTRSNKPINTKKHQYVVGHSVLTLEA
jgi:hypothetical protein